MQWRQSSSPKQKNFRQYPYTRRKITTIFWNEKGVFFIDFMERSSTFTADVYCEALPNLSHVIQNRERGKLSSGVVLLHDNARLNENFCWKLFDHPSYSSDFALSNYFLLLHWKQWFGGRRFESYEEFKSDFSDGGMDMEEGERNWFRVTKTSVGANMWKNNVDI